MTKQHLPPVQLVCRAAATGQLRYHLSTPENLEQLLGEPVERISEEGGGMESLRLVYPGVEAMFSRHRDRNAVFWLGSVSAEGKPLDIGADQEMVLRSVGELKLFDTFFGFWGDACGVSLAGLDLRDSEGRLSKLPFDSRTRWPGPARLPAGFDPASLLESSKDPGLGVRQLRAKGIDGSGVAVGIIDQPMPTDHQEYADNLVQYEGIDVAGVRPQMHRPPVASILVGRTCGVAPGAELMYYAAAFWKWD